VRLVRACVCSCLSIYSVGWFATVSLSIEPFFGHERIIILSICAAQTQKSERKKGERKKESSKILWIFSVAAEEARCADWLGFFFQQAGFGYGS
jgi:hypothetical protein